MQMNADNLQRGSNVQISADTLAEEQVGNVTTLIKIKGINDPPVVTNPQDGYKQPEVSNRSPKHQTLDPWPLTRDLRL